MAPVPKTHHFLMLLALLAGDAHGLEIAREVERLSEGRVRLWPATLYGSLEDLLECGWIEELREQHAGERKRRYRITRSGQAVARGETRRLVDLVRVGPLAGAAAGGDRLSPQAARRVYRALLRLAPRGLRERHGAEMEALFLERWAETRGDSVALWARAAFDLAGARALALRRALERARPPGTRTRRTLMLGHDLRFALRSLLRQRLAGALVVAMLALGLAANVAVFGLINGLFLRPLPFPDPERLVYLNERAPRWNLDVVGINYPDFDQWRREQHLFEAIACYDTASFNASDGTNALRIEGAQVTHDFAAVLGVKPDLGRFFAAEEDRPKGPPVVVLGHGFWQDRFAGDRDVLGKTLRLDGVARTVIGVMPRGIDFPGGVRLYVPLAAEPQADGQSYGGHGLGRLKPGVTAAQGEADLLRTQQPIWDARDKEKIVSPYAIPLREELVRDFRASAQALVGAVGLLLLVACANVASLMLARALARRREIAIRVAVGASAGRLLRQLLVENLLFAVVGGALGLALGYAALQALVSAIPKRSRAGPSSASTPASSRSPSPPPRSRSALRLGAGAPRAARRPAPGDVDRRLRAPRARRAAGARCGCWWAPSSRSRRCCWCAAGSCCRRTPACARSTRASARRRADLLAAAARIDVSGRRQTARVLGSARPTPARAPGVVQAGAHHVPAARLPLGERSSRSRAAPRPPVTPTLWS